MAERANVWRMKHWSVIGALVTAGVFLTSCAQEPSAQQTAAALPLGAQPDAHRATSWMLPEASAKKALLYVSDGYENVVYVYDYKDHVQAGTLSGFYNPGPQCVDRKGDVYIINSGTETTLEFKRGGTSIVNTYRNGSDDAVGCAVDAAGDLAITSLDPGQIIVYGGGKGTGQTYTDSNCTYMWPAGYDGSGNLYAEGHGSGGVVICELPKGATQMREVSLSTFIQFPGSIQWDGKYLTVTDQEYQGLYNTALYQTTESSSGGLTVVGKTVLTASCNTDYTEVLEPYIVGNANAPIMHKQGKVVVGGNGQCSDAGVNVWPYPAGGLPKKSFGLYNVDGISVSFK
jgi:hypothetical protein